MHFPDWPDYRPKDRRNGLRNIAFACAVTALGWFAVSVLWAAYHNHDMSYQVMQTIATAFAVTATAVVASVILFFFSLFGVRKQAPPLTRFAFQPSTLVIAPDGLALSSGSLHGELRWHELRGITRNTPYRLGADPYQLGVRAIRLDVGGASIDILDIYHWPIEHIEYVIRKYAGRVVAAP
jgi:hypothetical protein